MMKSDGTYKQIEMFPGEILLSGNAAARYEAMVNADKKLRETLVAYQEASKQFEEAAVSFIEGLESE